MRVKKIARTGGRKIAKSSRKNTVERERKFRVKHLPDRLSQYPHQEIRQGYLAVTEDQLEVRIRSRGDQYTITVKKGRGQERTEIEMEISRSKFQDLWPLTKGKRVEKTRYEIPFKGQKIELDVYKGKLRKLVTAEIEFYSSKSSKTFSPPEWFDKEVTGKQKFSNWHLAQFGMPRFPRR